MQGGEDDQHVVAGVGPDGDVGDRPEHGARPQEIGPLQADGLEAFDDGAEDRLVEKGPQQGGDDARDGKGHKEGHAEEGFGAHHRRVQQQGQHEG